jgi:hypothetical protein
MPETRHVVGGLQKSGCSSTRRANGEEMSEIAIWGVIVQGYGAATFNLEKQIPLIAREFPEITDCHRGSMNVWLNRSLRVDHPDHHTGAIDWGDPNPGEFGIHRVSIQFAPDGPVYRAWLYIPYNSPHYQYRDRIEVIAEKIPGIRYGLACQLNIPAGRSESDDLVVI